MIEHRRDNRTLYVCLVLFGSPLISRMV